MDQRIEWSDDLVDPVEIDLLDDDSGDVPPAPPEPPREPLRGGGGGRPQPMTDDAFLGTGVMLAGIGVLLGFTGIALAILLSGASMGRWGAGALGGSFVALYVIALNVGARWFYRHR